MTPAGWVILDKVRKLRHAVEVRTKPPRHTQEALEAGLLEVVGLEAAGCTDDEQDAGRQARRLGWEYLPETKQVRWFNYF